MKNEIIGKLVNEGLSEEFIDLTENEQISLQEITKITGQIDLLKEMEKIDSSIALKKVKASIANKRIIKWRSNLQKVASVLILPLLMVVIWQGIKLKNSHEEISFNEITTQPTLRSNFTLPDGTKVWLNGNTTIKYPTRFEGNERLVSLSGEAYFEVAKNKQKPFLVQINNLLVEATGTQFNISSYVDENIQEILLTEGSINIHYANGNERKLLTMLRINELAKFDNKSRKLKIDNVEPEKYIAWKTGKIVFYNDQLTDVIKKLERWYNVDFTYSSNAVRDYAFTGTFAGEDLSQILKCIEITTPIYFEIEHPRKNQNNEYQQTLIEITNLKQ